MYIEEFENIHDPEEDNPFVKEYLEKNYENKISKLGESSMNYKKSTNITEDKKNKKNKKNKDNKEHPKINAETKKPKTEINFEKPKKKEEESKTVKQVKKVDKNIEEKNKDNEKNNNKNSNIHNILDSFHITKEFLEPNKNENPEDKLSKDDNWVVSCNNQ